MNALPWLIVGALLLASGSALAWPLEGRISSYFGEERPSGPHNGVDIAAPVGTPVRAPFAGQVVEQWWSDRGGYSMAIERADGVRAGFAHLDAYTVVEGEGVRAGEVVATTGNTGNTTGPHLHYTVKVRGEYVDPLQFHGRA